MLKHIYFGISPPSSHKRRHHPRGHAPLGTSGTLSVSVSDSEFKRERGKGEEEGGSPGELGEGPGVADLQQCGGCPEHVMF